MTTTATKRATSQAQVTASQLRADIYNLLDRVIESGQPLAVERKGVVLKIVLEKPMSTLEKIKANATPTWIGEPMDIFSIDHMQEWREEWGVKDDEPRKHTSDK